MLITDLIDIKNNNVKNILDKIRFNKSLTKKDIANVTGLSFATVSNLCNELKEIGILSDSKLNERRVGRIPNIIALNYDKFYSVAIDLQLENVLGFAIVNIRNQVIFNQIFDITQIDQPEIIVSFCKQIFDEFIRNRVVNEAVFIGIGVAVPAVFDSQNGKLVCSAIKIYEGAPLKDLFSKAFDLPAYVDNIANIRALSVYTRFQNKKSIVCLDVSQGVGVGIISEGNLIKGKNGYATEIAHVPIGNPDLTCNGCGGKGCVETELSISGMTAYFPQIDRELPTLKRWEAFVKNMKDVNDTTETIAKNLGSLIGKLTTIIINLFDPEIFTVNGYIIDVFDRMYPYFIEEINKRCKLQLDRGLQIELELDSQLNVYIGLGDTIYNNWNPMLYTNELYNAKHQI